MDACKRYRNCLPDCSVVSLAVITPPAAMGVCTAESSASWLSGSYHVSVLRLKISRSPLSLPFTSRSSKRAFSKRLPVRIRYVVFVTLVSGYSLSSTKWSVFVARFILISHFFSHRPTGMFTRIFFLQMCNVFPFFQ